MYAVDINLLKERPGYRQEVTTRTQAVNTFDRGPLFLGVAVGGSFLGLTLAIFLVLTALSQRLTAREQELDQQLAQLAPELARIESLKAEQQRLKAETNALASIFNQVRPWSATLQDMRDRVPVGLQITSLQQAGATGSSASGSSTSPSPSPSPSASPSPGATTPAPTGDLTIKGSALSFSDVSDFVLALQNSAFLKGDVTQLVQAQRQTSTPTNSSTSNAPAAPSLVEYQIQTSVSDVPASDLLQELNRKGAVGLVTRIQILREKGVLQR